MLNRGIFIILLSVELFAVASLVTGFAEPFLTGSFDQTALIGGLYGFASFIKLPFLASGSMEWEGLRSPRSARSLLTW